VLTVYNTLYKFEQTQIQLSVIVSGVECVVLQFRRKSFSSLLTL